MVKKKTTKTLVFPKVWVRTREGADEDGRYTAGAVLIGRVNATPWAEDEWWPTKSGCISDLNKVAKKIRVEVERYTKKHGKFNMSGFENEYPSFEHYDLLKNNGSTR